MINKEYGKFKLVCDNCDKEEAFDTFTDAIDYAREEGWKTVKVTSDFEHYCDECV